MRTTKTKRTKTSSSKRRADDVEIAQQISCRMMTTSLAFCDAYIWFKNKCVSCARDLRTKGGERKRVSMICALLRFFSSFPSGPGKCSLMEAWRSLIIFSSRRAANPKQWKIHFFFSLGVCQHATKQTRTNYHPKPDLGKKVTWKPSSRTTGIRT